MNIDYGRRHLQFGWWSVFVFTALGLALELMQGYKVPAYVDASNDTRRLMWTLAHAHGTLLGLLNIVFGLMVRTTAAGPRLGRVLGSWCLIAATVLLPGGFLLGGVVVYSGDPGPGIFVVPVGAAALLVALFFAALVAGQPSRDLPVDTATNRSKRGRSSPSE